MTISSQSLTRAEKLKLKSILANASQSERATLDKKMSRAVQAAIAASGVAESRRIKTRIAERVRRAILNSVTR
jgi:hypothetical protein